MRVGASALIAILLALACVGAGPSEAGGPAIVVEGKALEDWLRILKGKDEDKAWEAVRALMHARFLVGAADVAVPALTVALGTPPDRFGDLSRPQHFAIAALGAYGPLAREAAAGLRRMATERAYGFGAACSLVLIGEDVAAQRARIQREVRPIAADVHPDVYRLLPGQRLGLRGEDLLDLAKAALDGKGAEYRPALARAYGMGAAQSLRGVAAPLAPRLLPYLEEKEKIKRGEAVVALSWIPRLAPESVRKVLRAFTGIVSAHALVAMQGLAVTHHEPKADLLAFFRTGLSSQDAGVRSWAAAGLARRAPAESVLPTLRSSIVHSSDEARVAAADGLLALGAGAASLFPALEKALGDRDLRVRWRAAAALLRAGREEPVLLAELRRGVEGPDDFDRVACFTALVEVGPRARDLADAIRPFVELPFPPVAEPAKKALDAVLR